MTTGTPLAAAPVVPVVPAPGDAALRDAVRTLARTRVQAAHDVAGGGRWRGDGGELVGEAGTAVARELEAFARAARQRGTAITEVLVAVSAAVRAAGALLDVGPREALVRDARRCCVRGFYEARAPETTPDDAEHARPATPQPVEP